MQRKKKKVPVIGNKSVSTQSEQADLLRVPIKDERCSLSHGPLSCPLWNS